MTDIAPGAAGAALDETDRRILSGIQVDFPVVRWPYEALSSRLDVAGDEILYRVRRLCEAGIVRRIGAVFSSRRLGYVSTLVAARVPPERLEAAAAEASRLEGVTHNYAREHEYNLWFTLAARDEAELEEALRGLRARMGEGDMLSLPTVASYKAWAVFPLDGSPPPGADKRGQSPADSAGYSPLLSVSEVVQLDDSQKHLVRLLQEPLPLESTPLVTLAQQWRRPVEILIVHLRHWLATGLVRRFGAVVGPREIGLAASALVAFRVPPERAAEAGAALAGRAEVSHCHLRRAPAGWAYNLFAVVHGRDRDQVLSLVRDLSSRAGLTDPQVLFTAAEYKKVPMRFF